MTRVATIAAAAVLAVAPSAARLLAGRTPTVADIALCNEEAAAATRGGPSASPGPPPPSAAPRPEPLPPASEQTDPSGSIIMRSPDPLLEGMAADRADDTAFAVAPSAYRTAYRDCMQRRVGRPTR